jgi:biotin carboxylase
MPSDSDENKNEVEKDRSKTDIISLKEHQKWFYINEEALEISTEVIYGSAYVNKAILIIGSNGSGNASCLKIAQKMKYGVKVNLTSTECWSKEFFDETIIVDDRDLSKKEETLNAVKVFMKERDVEFDAVITVHEDSVQMASYLASELGCLCIPLEAVKTIQDKYEFRKYCEQVGIVSPKYNLIKHVERQKHIDAISYYQKTTSNSDDEKICSKLSSELIKTLTNIEFPFVVKNSSGSGKGKLLF